MSIQNRLLIVYTSIFMVAFLLFSAIVYLLPQYRIVDEVDQSLARLALELQSGSVVVGQNNTLLITIDPDLDTLETASTFFQVSDLEGNIELRSRNLGGFEGYLDQSALSNETNYTDVTYGNTSLRVMTIPLMDNQSDPPQLVGHLQVARLLDSIESFTGYLVVALFVGFAGGTVSLFIGVLVTPSSLRPLEVMSAVARQITNADDLSRRVPYTERPDEIGVLARSFNQLLERLEGLFQTQQRLMADVSHELRTPLTAIRGNVDLMRRMGNGDPESLDIIQEETERMTRLVGDLLLLARADAGGLPLEMKRVELDTIFFEVYRQVHLMQSKIEVHVVNVDPVCVNGDADRIKQLLLNLISNAFKYTPAGGKVELGLAKEDDWAYVTISDTGVGIPEEDLPFIFDRFYRVDKARARSKGGVGLGLSIAQWIANAHGGEIRAESVVDEGTTFTIVLPAMPDRVEPERNGEDTQERRGRTRTGQRVFGTGFRRP